MRLADVIQHPKWQKAMNEELMGIEENNIMTQIGFNLDVPNKIYVDNVYAINLAKNMFFHQRSKHIDIRYHFLRDQVGKNMIKLEYCRLENQIADIFTKSLKIDAFIKLRDMFQIRIKGGCWLLILILLLLILILLPLNYFTVIISLMVSL